MIDISQDDQEARDLEAAFGQASITAARTASSRVVIGYCNYTFCRWEIAGP
jgi:hypothetical protein